MQEIAPGVYVSTVYPGINVGLIVTDGGAVAVDAPPLPDEARAWRERIAEIAHGPILYTILTDHHPDRALGTRMLGAPVIAGRGTFERLQAEAEGYGPMAVQEWLKRHPEVAAASGELQPALPEIAIEGRIVIQGSPEIAVETVAGAAPGSIWVLLPREGIVFAGDTIVVGTHPLLAETPSTKEWLETLVQVRRPHFPGRLIVPGRGPVCGKEETRPLSDYIQRVRRRVRSFHTAGRDRASLTGLLPEFLALFPVDDAGQEQVQRRIRAGLERVYDELRPEDAEG